MLWDITQLVIENHMQEWQDTSRNLFRDGFFFHSLHRLKKLMYFLFSHHVPIFTSNWESRAPTDQWSPCRAYVNTKSLEELWQLSWKYIPEILSTVNSDHLYSQLETSRGYGTKWWDPYTANCGPEIGHVPGQNNISVLLLLKTLPIHFWASLVS